RALLEEFRIADDAEGLARFFCDDITHIRRRADRHRTLVDHDRVLVHRTADIARHLQDVLQIRGAVYPLRSTDGDEHDFGGVHRGRQVSRKPQALLFTIAAYELLE